MHDVGDTVRLTALTTDGFGVPANVGTMAIVVTLPDGSTASPVITNSGTGSYYADFTTTQAGRHTVVWTGTGSNAQVYTDEFDVTGTVPGYIISLRQARTAIGIPVTNTSKDDDLRDYLAAATPIMEDLVGPILSVACDEYLDGGSFGIRLTYYPVLTVTKVTESYGSGYVRTLTEQPLDGTANYDAFGYTIDKTDGRIMRRASGHDSVFTEGRRTVHVVYTAGRTTPLRGNLRLATRRLVRHLWQSEQQGIRPEYGQPDASMGYTPSGFAVPKAVIELCGSDLRVPGIG